MPLTPYDKGQIVPKLVKTVNPLFPEEAAPGLVVMQVKIASNGRIVDAVVLKSTNKELDKAALDAVRKWRYRLQPCEKVRAPIPWVVTAKFGGTIW
ncbi:MAG: TonB family protein [Acidobacteriota bacterium]